MDLALYPLRQDYSTSTNSYRKSTNMDRIFDNNKKALHFNTLRV